MCNKVEVTTTVEPVTEFTKKVAVFVDGAFIGERIYDNIVNVDELVAYIATCYEEDVIPQW